MFKHATWLIPAALVGLVAGFVGSSLRHPVLLHAMTAHGSERKTLVTVPLDAGMEAVATTIHPPGLRETTLRFSEKESA